MIDPAAVAMRVEIMTKNCHPPLRVDPDEIAASLHAVGLGLLHCGGAKQLDNAVAVLEGVVITWPEAMRPTAAEIAKQAAWVTRQDPMALSAPRTTANPLQERIEAAIAGRLVAVPWPWASVGGLTQALMPGAVTLLVGAPGASKSFMLLQAVLWWLGEGWRCALCELEEDAGFWLNRALAVVAGCGPATDPAWMASHSDQVRALFAQHRERLDQLADSLTTAPAGGMTLAGLAEWIEEKAKTGHRIIVADPITAALESGDKPWAAAQMFMLRAKRAASAHGASLVLTSHGKKTMGQTKGPPDLDSLAGGAAFARFASCVLWLEALADTEEVGVLDADGRERNASINRRLRILKAREGRGTGLVLGMRFHGGSLRTSEAGVIVTSSAQARRVQARASGSDGRDRAAGTGVEDRAEEMRARGEKLRQPISQSEDAFADGQGPT